MDQIKRSRKGDIMKIQTFKKGDKVPQWIENTVNCELLFDTDVEVVVDSDGVTIFPQTTDFKQVMVGKINDIGAPAYINGAPTILSYTTS